MDIRLIRKYALQNAVKYSGKASPGAVIGHILARDPSLKSNAREISKQVIETIKEVNQLGPEKQKQELEKTAPELLKEKRPEQRKELPALKNVKGKVIMRFEPSPSGPMHIGHAYVLGLNSQYAEKYNGELILRIGDTNPENIYEPAYELIPADAKWLTKNNISKVIIQSERLKLYYSYMEKLLNLDKAYICTCNPEKYKELINKSQACPCRKLPKEEQLKRWEKMFIGYRQGDAVARIKTDLSHKNPAMRDFPVFRINEEKHPKQKNKYRVWPLMNMAVTVDDIELGVTHIIRAKDHYDNALRQNYIYEYLNKPFPEAIFVGRINFEGMPVSCTKTREAINKKKYKGWDDIRLPFLLALKRRGYKPEAFLKYAFDVGVTLTDKRVTKDEFFKVINAFNKDVIDKTSSRYFFVWEPKKVTIENAPEQAIELDLHPEHKKGGRNFRVKDRFCITKEDYRSLRSNKLYRLMDCLNFTKKGNKLVFHSLEYEKYKSQGERIMHWLPEETVRMEVLMPDNKLVKGFGEKGLAKLKQGSICQLERFGFCRLDDKEKLRFWFAHK